MTYFPLRFTATLQREQITVDRSGQQIVSGFDETQIKKCLFLETSGNKKPQINEAFQGVLAFYTEHTVDIEEGDRIVNIRDRTGKIIEPGPYEVLSVKHVPSYLGKPHHISCKLRGVA